MSKQFNPVFAQRALFFIFSSFGLLIGLWAAFIPLLQTKLNLSPDTLGLSIFCFGLGAVLATFFVPNYIKRYQTRSVMILSGILMWMVFPITINAPTVISFILLLTILGFFCGLLDASMNSHAFTVEHFLQKPSLSLFHGGFSLGCVVGSAFSAWIISLSLPLNLIAITVSFCSISALMLSKSFCYSSDFSNQKGTDSESINNQRLPRQLIIVALLTAICFFSEGAIGDWSGLFLRDIKLANPAQTALSLGAFATGMAIARFMGDRLRAKYATQPLLFASSVLATSMILVFLLVPDPIFALAVLFVAGLGFANIVPLLFVRAAHIDGVSSSRGVAFAAGMGYASLLGGPALLGYIAKDMGLMFAMLMIAIATAILAVEAFYQYKKTLP